MDIEDDLIDFLVLGRERGISRAKAHRFVDHAVWIDTRNMRERRASCADVHRLVDDVFDAPWSDDPGIAADRAICNRVKQTFDRESERAAS